MRILFALGGALAVAAVAWLRPAAPGEAGVPAWSSPAPVRAPPAQTVVYVAGAVRRPGVYQLAAGARVADALARAGGARAEADLIAVNLAARLRDGDEIAVPVRGAPAVRSRRSPAPHRALRRRRAAPRRDALVRAVPARTYDLNRAPAAQLAGIPGLSAALAARIVAFRELNGPFDDVHDLIEVSGIDDRRLAAVAAYLAVP